MTLYLHPLLLILLFISVSRFADAATSEEEGVDDYADKDIGNNPAALQLFSQAMFSRISNMSNILSDDVKKDLSFCVEDVLVIFFIF